VVQTLVKSWWLLAVGGLLYALFSAMILLMQTSNGSIVLRTNFYTRDAITQLGLLALAAGVCTIAAALWSGRKGSSWLLVLATFFFLRRRQPIAPGKTHSVLVADFANTTDDPVFEGSPHQTSQIVR
jgi:hypothetical protein